MDEKLIERAVEAAAKAAYKRAAEESHVPVTLWESQSRQVRDFWRARQRHAITAALAEVEADIRAGALRDLADHMEKDGLRFIHISVVTDYADTIEKEDKA